MNTFPEHLLEGYKAFATQRLPTEQTRYRELSVKGQFPEVMVIGCCDSRVSPEVIFDVGPGELFVVRNVANLVPPYSPDNAYHGVSSALEYAVTVLQVRHIVVLGHARCGGVRAFADDSAGGEFIGKWMSLLAPVAAAVEPHDDGPDSYLTRLEQASILASLGNLRTFPFIRRRCESSTLTLHGAYFDVASGELSALEAGSRRFEPLTPPSSSPQ